MTLGNRMVALFLILGMSFSICIYLALQWSVFPASAHFERASSRAAPARVARALDGDVRLQPRAAAAFQELEYARVDSALDPAAGSATA